MKRLLLLCSFVLLTNLASAQREINYDFTNKMNALFGQLDKSKIPHGILLDYGMEFTNLEEFDGILTDRNYVTMGRLEEIYKTLLTSKINPTTNNLVTPAVFKNNLKNNRTKGVIALSGLFYNYSKFKDDALIRNRVRHSRGKFYDVYSRGRWQNPYETTQTFVMSPAIKKYSGLEMQVKIPSTIFYSNNSNQVQNIQIDFGNGNGYVTIPFNQNIEVNYATEGIKTWKYKLNLSNGKSLYSHSKIKIEEGYTTVSYGSQNYQKTTNNNTNVYQSQRITATDSYLGQKSSVNLTIDLANGNTQITKPLIVAEGFDVGVILSPENEYGFSGYRNFRTSLNNSGELYDLIGGYNKDYDIIYIDWDNGVDYLQRNAYALEEVIKWVNSVKQGNEPNVVLGQSMGGVIGRWALADMEERGMNHDTRLFISHDAPQQGANVPIAVQYMYRQVQNQFINTSAGVLVSLFSDIEEPFKLLDTPAARQLLKNRAVNNYGLNNSSHTSFYNELKNKGLNNNGGYPLNSRNIAVSNGSECGDAQFGAGSYLLQYQDTNKLSFIQNIIAPFVSFLGGGLLGDIDLWGVTVLSLFPGSSKYNIDFWAKSIPYGNGNQIYKGKISYTKKILWIISVTTNITNVNKNKPSGMLPFDSYGGGYYATTNSDISLPDGVYLRDKFNFIPTVSALDIGKNKVTLNDSDYLRSYVGGNPPTGTKSSPFDNFSTDFDTNPDIHNKPHISFNPRNGDWLASELKGGNSIETTDCSAFCSDSAIIGEDMLCSSGNYSINTGSYVNWSITEGNDIVSLSSISNNTANVSQVNSNRSGYVTLRGYVNSECGNITLSKRFWVGVPSKDDLRITTTGNGIYVFSKTWQELFAFGGDNIEWSFNTSVMTRDSGSNSIMVYPTSNTGSIRVGIRARNECGYSQWKYKNFTIYQTTTDGGIGIMH